MKTKECSREKRYNECVKAASIDGDKRTMTVQMSTNSVDRDGEIIEPTAFKDRIKSFMDNPVLLWMHDPFSPPIGKVNDVAFEKNGLVGEVQFRKEGKSPRADEIFSAYEEGVLTSFSIGFRALKIEFSEDEETGKSDPPRITEGELLELSAVTIPANTEAVVKRAQKAATLLEGLDQWCEHRGLERPNYRLDLGEEKQHTVYTAPTDLQILEKAPEIIDRVLGLKAKGDVRAEELEAIAALRAVLIPAKSLPDVGVTSDELEDLGRQLDDLGTIFE